MDFWMSHKAKHKIQSFVYKVCGILLVKKLSMFLKACSIPSGYQTSRWAYGILTLCVVLGGCWVNQTVWQSHQHDWDQSSHLVFRRSSIQFAHLLKLSAPCHSSLGSGNEAPSWVTGMMDSSVTDSDRTRLIVGRRQGTSHPSHSWAPPQSPLENNMSNSHLDLWKKMSIMAGGRLMFNSNCFFLSNCQMI